MKLAPPTRAHQVCTQLTRSVGTIRHFLGPTKGEFFNSNNRWRRDRRVDATAMSLVGGFASRR
eukprot:9472558-Pyramimonas_sp.AAC.1